MATIVWLDDRNGALEQLGGKGASLAALYRGGFNVPPGFCVTAPGYHRFIEHNHLAGPITQLLATPDLKQPKVARSASAALAPLLDQATLPPALVAQIDDAYRWLCTIVGDGVAVVARSSALSEDAAGASSAGLYDTYLNLRDEQAVLTSVLRCYRSLWTFRAVQYRAFVGLDSAAEAMAVVVMQLVQSEVSGVAFTVNPLTGDRNQIMINASWGLGEAIVSGRVTPDQFLLDKASLAIVTREIYPKEVEVRPDPGGGSGTVDLAVSAERAATPALAEAAVQELGALCVRIERQYDRPVDIEWAYAGGKLYVLQARPVTALK